MSEAHVCGKKDENKMAFLIREHILALLGDHTVSIEEALLESFYILLELYKNQSVTPELVEEYFSPEILLQLRTAITQAKSTISSLETWEECNELLQDLAVNYRKEGLYEKFLTPVITQAEYYSQIFGRQGIHVGSTVPIAAARCMSTALTTASVSLNTLAHSTQKSLVERSARHSTVSMKMWYFPLSPICSEP